MKYCEIGTRLFVRSSSRGSGRDSNVILHKSDILLNVVFTLAEGHACALVPTLLN